MSIDISDLLPVVDPEPSVTLSGQPNRRTPFKNGITMFVLFLINLLNYMDRFAIAGVLDKIQVDFNISDTQGGLIQTVFVCSYMTLAPLFGYLGDRHSRKILIIVGVTLWSLTTLAGSFVPKHLFTVFVVLRGIVGIGEASYSCVAPTIIADMYRKDKRTVMLAVFNIAVPLGSGLGYILGAYVAKAFNNDWRWALRITPGLGALCVILLIVLVKEPVRGTADGALVLKRNKWLFDIQQIMKVKSFVLITFGFTWVAFALGSLSWWGPKFIQLAHGLYNGYTNEKIKAQDSLFFGIATCFSGLVGVVLGSEVARRYRKREPRADPIVCGAAILLSLPFLFSVLAFSRYNLISTWFCIVIAETLLCTNWALISDMLLYIIIPTRRSTASAIQIFILHLFGDATSPLIVGKISDWFRNKSEDPLKTWESLRNALMLTPAVAGMGGIAFLLASLVIIRDRHAAEMHIESSNVSEAYRMDEQGSALDR